MIASINAIATIQRLSPSNVLANEFQSIYLLHQLLGEEQLLWLKQYSHLRLSDDEARALILAKETGAVDNAALRAVTDLDTLAASQVLKRLHHQLHLLEQGGAGSATYYRLTNKDLSEENLPLFAASVSKESGLNVNASDLNLPQELKQCVNKLTTKPRKETLWPLILKLCDFSPMTSRQLALLLGRTETHLKTNHLTEMRKAELINYLYHEVINHPEQAYVIMEQGKRSLCLHDFKNADKKVKQEL